MSEHQPSNPPAQAQGKNSGLAIASMVLGIVWVFYIGSVLAVIFGHVALSKMKKDPSIGGRGFAVAGVVLGWLGVGIFILFSLILGVGIASG